MKKLIFFALLFAAPAAAQLPQFSGLPTTTSDYTCGGVFPCSTWPMPPIPSAGGSWTDPNTSVSLYRLTYPAANAYTAVSPYSRVQAWNINNTRMFLCESNNPSMDLYDTTTTPPTPIARITPSDGSLLYTCSGDGYWAHSTSTPNRIYYIPFGSGANSLQLRYIDVSACTSGPCSPTPVLVHDFGASGNACTSDRYFPGMDISSFSINGSTNVITFVGNSGILSAADTVEIYGTGISYLDNQTLTVSATGLSSSGFQATFVHATVGATTINGIAGKAGVAGNVIESGSGGQGGFFDATDNYFSFTCDLTSGPGRAEMDWIRYRRDTDTITTQKKWYTVCPTGLPASCKVWGTSDSFVPSKEGWDMIRMNQHVDQNYIQVIWNAVSSDDTTWAVGDGIEYYSPTYALLGPVTGYGGHNDHGYDVNGVPTFVGVGYDNSIAGNADYYSLTVANLTTLSPTAVVNKHIVLPVTYAYQNAGSLFLSSKVNCPHVSMTATWGSTPGYALSSTCMVGVGSGDGISPDYPAATTVSTAVPGAGTFTVTPGSMAQISRGSQLLVDCNPPAPGYGCRSGNYETITVASTTSTTFTAPFLLAHSGGFDVNNITIGDTGFGAMAMYAVKIDTTATDGAAAQTWQIARAMSVRDADYGAEPHAACNNNWTQCTWGSNWNTDNGTDYGFWLALNSATSFPLTVSIAGNGASHGGFGTGSVNCEVGTSSIPSGDTVTCVPTAYAGSGWVFTGFGGACQGFYCSFTMTETSAVTANYVLTTQQGLNLENVTAATAPNLTAALGWNIDNIPGHLGGVTAPASSTQSNGNSSPAGGCTGTSLADTQTSTSTSSYWNTLWWNWIAGADTATNFVLEACVYVSNIAAVNNVELDFDQYNATNGNLYSFGHHYNIASGCWWYNNNTYGWQETSACPAFAGNTWHHLFFTGHRVPGDTGCGGDGCDYIDAIAQDGFTYPINETLPNEPLDGLPTALIAQQESDGNPTTGTPATIVVSVNNMNFSAYTLGTASTPASSAALLESTIQ